jgi:methylase of polypeptide subunit release factors
MIRIGDRQQFATVREFLGKAYAEESDILADRVGDFKPELHNDEPPLVRMFFLGRAISTSEWEAVASGEVRTAFSDLGLIEPASNGRIRSSVVLYRISDVYVTSDRFTTDEGEVVRPAEDSVYYALTETAQHYIHSLPRRPCGRVLDIGSGSGVASLLLAGHAEQIVATDITDRSVLFTEFNAKLNRFENIVTRLGSLYEPVEGMQFDLITCHPPYDISISSKRYIYADGGTDGEFVTRGVIAGLPRMLKPNGQFIAAVRATDRKAGSFEARVRDWLGEAHTGFDIAAVVRSTIRPEEHAISASMLAKQNLDDYAQYMELFQSLGVTRLPYVHLLVERKAQGEPITVRRDMGRRCTFSEMEAALEHERAKRITWSGATRLSPSEHMELVVRHAFREGEVTPVEYRFSVDHPFREEVPVPEWVAKLVALCVAGRTWDDVFTAMREEYPIGRPDFDAAVKRLVSVGVLETRS